MKLKENVNLVEFLRQTRNCKSEVYLETEDEDKLNLKSVLSQYVVVVMAGQRDLLENAQVVCKEDEDYQALSAYLTA